MYEDLVARTGDPGSSTRSRGDRRAAAARRRAALHRADPAEGYRRGCASCRKTTAGHAIEFFLVRDPRAVPIAELNRDPEAAQV